MVPIPMLVQTFSSPWTVVGGLPNPTPCCVREKGTSGSVG